MVSADLTEPGVKKWIRHALHVQRSKRNKLINILFNVGMFLALATVVCSTLYVRYRSNNNQEERKEKSIKREQYIIEKLQRLAAVQSKHGMITTLPTFENFCQG